MAYGTDDIFSFSAFDPARLTDSFREFAEKGAVQSREAYAKVKAATEEASKTVETTLRSAQAGSVEVGLKAIEALRTNADLSLSHMEALLGVKSVSEFVELQTAFIRKQAEITVDQARAIQDATRKLAEAVSQPGKDAAEKVMSTFKAA
ncbi:phasin [Pseudorhizobium endolithicum]|uniref:Phasin n=1 Tax=Pseudorhizobium endolithicum TaxID=1191678 RepID=A0ABM8PY72_9HYPH|nr:phasin [Pseudorhizobium endolithicum]CAD7054625.1 phasin [Pseudorhizobium endolithicum]